jgi:peptide chain release factor subunit 3
MLISSAPQALLHYFDRATGRKSRKPPQFAKRGQKIVALIEATAPVCVERFVDYPQLGRFTLRDEGALRHRVQLGTGAD